jgi:hypothetical protein
VLVGNDQLVVLGELEGHFSEQSLVVRIRHPVVVWTRVRPELGVRVLLPLGIAVKPDFILYDPAGEVESGVPVLADLIRIFGAFNVVADKAAGNGVEVQPSVEIVSSGLGDDVDHRALEIPVLRRSADGDNLAFGIDIGVVPDPGRAVPVE